MIPLRRQGAPDCAYVRSHYGLQVRRGDRVVTAEGAGRVCGATHHVWVQLDGQRQPAPWHPSDVQIEGANSAEEAS